MQFTNPNETFTISIVDRNGDSIKVSGTAAQLDTIGHALKAAGAVWYAGEGWKFPK
jgi:hypothetical protein